MAKNLYNFSIQDIDGNTVNLDKFKGKPILLVIRLVDVVSQNNTLIYPIFIVSILKRI